MTKKLLGSLELNRIYQRECIEGMTLIPDKSVDMILCDLPYGTTACKWDNVIPFDKMWEQYERIIKDNGAIVLTASQPFTSALIMSKPNLFKYEWIWSKNVPTGFQNAKNQPLKKHENVCVFSKGNMVHEHQTKNRMRYFPQGLIEVNETKTVTASKRKSTDILGERKNQIGKEYVKQHKNYPTSLLQYDREVGYHPTQKPVTLFEYLIRTYTNEGEIVLDNCMGSGTTAVACVRTNRNFIGFETEPQYVEIANKRLDNEEASE